MRRLNQTLLLIFRTRLEHISDFSEQLIVADKNPPPTFSRHGNERKPVGPPMDWEEFDSTCGKEDHGQSLRGTYIRYEDAVRGFEKGVEELEEASVE